MECETVQAWHLSLLIVWVIDGLDYPDNIGKSILGTIFILSTTLEITIKYVIIGQKTSGVFMVTIYTGDEILKANLDPTFYSTPEFPGIPLFIYGEVAIWAQS